MMLTSGGHYGDAQRCRDLGIRAYLNKPVKAAELFDAICRALDGAPSAAPAPAPAGSVALAAAPLAILLAEDNVVNQRVAVGLLSRRGHRVVVAGTGREAIEKFDREPFDVVLMDVQMPEMGGFEATAEIRRREAGSGRRTRIVAMTAHAMAGDRERCMAAGMDGYVAKPIVPAALFEGIERADEQHPLEPAAFDHDELLSRLGGDEELLADVVKMFLEDCPKRLAAIRRAIDAADAPLVRAEAHALKGAAGNLSAGALSAAARAIESAAAAGHLDGAARGWRQLSADAERLMDALRRANFCEA
jgi:CheY-like chemotaxis protein